MEGYIHASSALQLQATILRYYASCEHVVVLTINTALLTAKLQYDLAPSVNQIFPHIYGTINKDAVEGVEVIYIADIKA